MRESLIEANSVSIHTYAYVLPGEAGVEIIEGRTIKKPLQELQRAIREMYSLWQALSGAVKCTYRQSVLTY
jgi:hypothetical protein